MKLIAKLEKNRNFWLFFLILTIFFLLRFPSLFEPYWYGDEGIYEVIGQALRRGRLLYVGIWDNKPPLLYLIYALFNGDQFSVRLASLIIGLLTTIIFFFLAKRLLENIRSSLIVTSLFALLFGTPFLEGNIANAENFMLLPIIGAALLLVSIRGNSQRQKFQSNNRPLSTIIKKYSANRKHVILYLHLFLSGLLLGIALLFKIVAVFDLSAFFVFIIMYSLYKIPFPQIASLIKKPKLRQKRKEIRTLLLSVSFLLLGFIMPCILPVIYFLANHAFTVFIQATILGNIDYTNYYNSAFLIPHGLLIVKSLLLFLYLVVLFWKRQTLTKPQLFVLIWFGFSIFDAFFSQRPYTHYLLVILPSFCLLIGLCIKTTKPRLRLYLSALLMVVCILIVINFTFYGVIKTIRYYQNVLLFLSNQETVTTYQSFFDSRVPRDYNVAAFITANTKPPENVFLWGDSAQIYALSHKLPPGRYIVAYHIDQTKQSLTETQTALVKANPRFIITLAEAPKFPFVITYFPKIIRLAGTTIYEKKF